MRSSSARSVPGRVAAPMRASSSTRSGRVQVGNAASSSAPSRKTGIVEAERLERVDGAGERIEGHLGLGDRREGELGEPEPDLRRRVDLLVPRVGDDADQQPVEPEVVDRLAGERDVPDVRRIEGATEDPDALAHSPDHDLVADLDLRAGPHPRVPQGRLQLLTLGRGADDAESLPRAQTP